MITQSDCVDSLKLDGYSVTERTLTYWRSERLLPPLLRVGSQYLWDESVLDQVKVLCDRGGRKPIFKFGSYEIVKAEIVKIGESIGIAMYTNERSVLLRKLREEIADAITKG